MDRLLYFTVSLLVLIEQSYALILPNQTICSAPVTCIQIPSGCTYNPANGTLNTCQALLVATPMPKSNDPVNGPWVQIELQSIIVNSNTPTYVALGLSKDKYMGDDSVLACVFDSTQTEIARNQISYNVAGIGSPGMHWANISGSPAVPHNVPVSSDPNFATNSNLTFSTLQSTWLANRWQYCKVVYKLAYPMIPAQKPIFSIDGLYNPLLAVGPATAIPNSPAYMLLHHMFAGAQPNYYNLYRGTTQYPQNANSVATPVFPPQTGINPIPALQPFGVGIDITKCPSPSTCFALSQSAGANCNYNVDPSKNTCDVVAMISPVGNGTNWIRVLLQAPEYSQSSNASYIAFGLSKDMYMGDDSVTYCMFSKRFASPISTITAGLSYNHPPGTGTPGNYSFPPFNIAVPTIANMSQYLRMGGGWRVDGWKFCEIYRQISVPFGLEDPNSVERWIFPMDGNYVPIFASGEANPGAAKGRVLLHHTAAAHGSMYYNFVSGMQLGTAKPTPAPPMIVSTTSSSGSTFVASIFTILSATLLKLSLMDVWSF